MESRDFQESLRYSARRQSGTRRSHTAIFRPFRQVEAVAQRNRCVRSRRSARSERVEHYLLPLIPRALVRERIELSESQLEPPRPKLKSVFRFVVSHHCWNSSSFVRVRDAKVLIEYQVVLEQERVVVTWTRMQSSCFLRTDVRRAAMACS